MFPICRQCRIAPGNDRRGWKNSKKITMSPSSQTPLGFFFFFFGSNLRANSHTTAFTPLTGTMRRVSLVFVFRIFTLCCSHHTVELRTLSSPPKETSYPLAVTPTSPILWPQAATKALCVQTHMNGIAQMWPFVTSLPANTRSSPFLCPELPSVLPSLCQTLMSSFLVQFTTFELHAIL